MARVPQGIAEGIVSYCLLAGLLPRPEHAVAGSSGSDADPDGAGATGAVADIGCGLLIPINAGVHAAAFELDADPFPWFLGTGAGVWPVLLDPLDVQDVGWVVRHQSVHRRAGMACFIPILASLDERDP